MLRRHVYPALDAALPGDLYATYQLDGAEHVATVDPSPWAIQHDLVDAGSYEPTSALSALKYHPADDELADDYSLRRVDPDDPRRQYHVHLFEIDWQTTAIYSHLEYRPDLRPVADETLLEALDRAREHYSPTWGAEWGDDGTTYVLGAHCDEVKRLVRLL